MFRSVSLEVSRGFVVHLVGLCAAGSRVDRRPIETYTMHELRFILNHAQLHSHSVRSLREFLGNQPLILIPPMLHLLIRGHDRADVV